MKKSLFIFLLLISLPLLAAEKFDTQEDEWEVQGKANFTRHLKKELRHDAQPESYLELGKAYLVGYGVKQNFSKAKKYLRKASRSSMHEADMWLAAFPYYLPEKKQKSDEQKKAFEQMLALAQEDIPTAQYFTAYYYLEGIGTEKDETASFKWLTRSATATLPDTDAQNRLGIYYSTGYPPYVKQDKEKAFKLFLSAAESENKHACYNVAQMYLSGEGTEKNEKRAFHFMRLSALGRYIPAQMALSEMYRNGMGVKQDNYGAFKWMYEAARQGNVEAQEKTALNYLQGYGIAKSRKEALSWAEKAQKNGGKNAAEIIHQIKEDL